MAIATISIDSSMGDHNAPFDFDVSQFNIDDFDQLTLKDKTSQPLVDSQSMTAISEKENFVANSSTEQTETYQLLDIELQNSQQPFKEIEKNSDLIKRPFNSTDNIESIPLSIDSSLFNSNELKIPRKSILKPSLPPDNFASRSSIIFRQGKDRIMERFLALNLHRNPSLNISDEYLGKELHPRDLKRVRFSFPLRSTSIIIPTSCQHFIPLENPITVDTLSPGLVTSALKKHLPVRDIIDWYLTLCRMREEIPIERFIRILEEASETQQEITSINMSGESLSYRTINPFADVLDLLFNLTRLELEDCDMDNESLKVICSNFLLNDRLTWLSLANNPKIHSEGFRSIATYLNQSKTLKFLDLSCISIDITAAKLIARGVMKRSHIPELSQLDFSEPSTPTSPISIDPNRTESFCSLEELRLNECSVHSAELKIICQGIRRSGLKNLSLCGNRISYLSAPAIASLLTGESTDNETPSLTSSLIFLDLSMNQLRNQGIEHLLEPLSSPYLRLRELKLSQNGIDELAMSRLFTALKSNRRLLSLDLSNNSVGGPSIEGIISLKDCLTLNHSIRSIFLSNTSLGSEGAVALAEMLPETKTLTRLDLSQNPSVSYAGLLALSISARLNFSITCLDVSIPPNDPEMASLTQDMLNTCIRNTQMLDDLSFGS